ncbi:hypothetical protein [Bradyrhizobium sp. WSM471]|uniref:hypothetical protein n=1 Tax=Bradyrhizobium sp. WSM471 TaxID=319017 RepID=UPI0012F7FF47|nr:MULTISPECIES: hypothetical protein [Bradyrhizobium]UFW43415.1 hypothetical protein BcanWSM471_10160 [Bradyrhizobium canariense]
MTSSIEDLQMLRLIMAFRKSRTATRAVWFCATLRKWRLSKPPFAFDKRLALVVPVGAPHRTSAASKTLTVLVVTLEYALFQIRVVGELSQSNCRKSFALIVIPPSSALPRKS